jgi:hypothetical protein
LKRKPKTFPILTPAIENRPVVRPIRRTDIQISTFRKANDTPMARASILVATAIASMVLKEKSGLTSSQSLSLDSFTIS